MKREEFLRELEGLLYDISEEERVDVLAFYRSYFEDAGEGNEAAILEELQSPQKVAEIIKKDLGIGGSLHVGNANVNGGSYTSYTGNAGTGLNREHETKQKKNSGSAVVAWTIVAVLTSPIWLTILLVVLSVMLSIVAALFGVFLAVLAVMVALVVVGFVLLGAGISLIVAGNPPVGMGLIGGGLLVLALGILAVVLGVWILGRLLPWVVRGVINLCKKPFAKRKEREAA